MTSLRSDQDKGNQFSHFLGVFTVFNFLKLEKSNS